MGKKDYAITQEMKSWIRWAYNCDRPMSQKYIANTLNDKGIPGPNKRKWSQSDVSRVALSLGLKRLGPSKNSKRPKPSRKAIVGAFTADKTKVTSETITSLKGFVTPEEMFAPHTVPASVIAPAKVANNADCSVLPVELTGITPQEGIRPIAKLPADFHNWRHLASQLLADNQEVVMMMLKERSEKQNEMKKNQELSDRIFALESLCFGLEKKSAVSSSMLEKLKVASHLLSDVQNGLV